jgi:Lysozyme like domain
MSSGMHRRDPYRGSHRKPSRAGHAAAAAGTLAAAGAIALAAAPAAGASVTAGGTPLVTHAVSAEHLAYLHWRHLRHEEHLAYLQELRDRHTVTTTFAEQDTVAAGIFSPDQLGQLWLEAGGSPAAESTAECIAHFESGGNSSAISPTDDFGLWQINASHGPVMATLDPMGNARAAVAISDDGTDWAAWTTAPDCGV